MVTLWLPITVIAFYRNSYPYFYVFILPTVAVACAVVLAGTFRRYGAAFLTAALVANAVAIASFEKHDVLERQRELLAGVEAVFPEPVAYFDYPAMLGIFPKANAFMSSWGSQNYLEGQSPTYGQIMARRAIPLVLENNAMFSNVLTGRPDSHFMPADAAALRENYIRFWGPVWLAGRELQEDESRTVEIAVPGPYTVADGAIVIDGKRYLSGEVVQLDRKSYRLRASDSSVRLIWGDHLVRPDSPPPAPPYWTEF
jgi:uncharacterized membrane protein YphA (DoxX/SURF4 family)